MPVVPLKLANETSIDTRNHVVRKAQYDKFNRPSTSSSCSVHLPDLFDSFMDEVINDVLLINPTVGNDMQDLDLSDFFSTPDNALPAKRSEKLPRNVSTESSAIDNVQEGFKYTERGSIISSDGNVRKFKSCEKIVRESFAIGDNDDNGIRKRKNIAANYSEYSSNQLGITFEIASINKKLKTSSNEPGEDSITNALRYTDATPNPPVGGQQENQTNFNKTHVLAMPVNNTLDYSSKYENPVTNNSSYNICYNLETSTVEIVPCTDETNSSILHLFPAPKQQRYQYPINILIDSIMSIGSENSISPNGKKRSDEEIQRIMELVISNTDASIFSKPDGPCRQCSLHILLKSKPWALDLVDIMLLRNPECGILVDAKHNTPLHIAIQYANQYKDYTTQCLEVIKHLFLLNPTAIAQVNMNGLTPYKMALYQSHCSEIISAFLLEKTNEINIRNFHHYAKNQKLDMKKY